MVGIGGDRSALHGLCHGHDRAQPRAARAQRRAAAQRRAVAVDGRYLQFPGGGLPHHHGQPGRSHRPAQAAADRCRRLRPGLADGRLLDQRRDADRHAGPAGRGRRHARAVHHVADPEHVPRRGAAPFRHRGVDRELLHGRGHRPAGGMASAVSKGHECRFCPGH